MDGPDPAPAHAMLNPVGFTEHKVDQAWIIDRGRRIDDKRIDAAFSFVKEKGLQFHWNLLPSFRCTIATEGRQTSGDLRS